MHSHDAVQERDLRRLLALVQQARESTDNTVLPLAVLDQIGQLVPCSEATFQVMDLAHDRMCGLVSTEDAPPHELADDPPDELDDVFWAAYRLEGGCSFPEDTRDYVSVVRRSDRQSARAYARTPMGRYMKLCGSRHTVLVPLPPDGALHRRLVLSRSDGPDFSEREVLLLTLLRPHLLELYDQQQRRLRPAPALTARQWEVLQGVARGESNAQIARALVLSEATVRKHLENVFVRLSCTSRTEALARVRPLLPPPGPVLWWGQDPPERAVTAGGTVRAPAS